MARKDTQLSQLLLQCCVWHWQNALPRPHATAVACSEVEPKWLQMNGKDPFYRQRLKIMIFQALSGLIPVGTSWKYFVIFKKTNREQAKGCLQGWWLSVFESMKKRWGISSPYNYFKGKNTLRWVIPGLVDLLGFFDWVVFCSVLCGFVCLFSFFL